REGDQFTDVVDALALEAVVAAHREVKVFDRHAELGRENGVDGCRADLDSLSSGVELTGEAEQLDQGLTSGCDGVARSDRRLGLDIHHQAVEVGALTGTSRLDTVGDLQNRGVDRVDRNLAGLAVLVAVLRRRNVAAATLDG